MKSYAVSLSLFTLILSLGLITWQCATIPTGADGQGRRAFILLPVSEERKMGAQAFSEILSQEKLSKDRRLNAMLQRVGKRVAAQAPVQMDWEFKLIDNEQANAFCLPGGKVAFYTGILPILENEAAMAAVMGHEIAHAVARHGAQRVSQAMAAQVGLAAVDATLLGDSKQRPLILAGHGLGAQVGVMLPFSRSHETEADTLGLRYAAAAGYDPREAARFWQRFSQKSGPGGTPNFLSTHPSGEHRIENLKRLEQEVMPLYKKSAKHGLGEKI